MVRNKPIAVGPPAAKSLKETSPAPRPSSEAPSGAKPRFAELPGAGQPGAESLGTKPWSARPPGATSPTAKLLAATEVDHRLRTALHELQLAERNAVLWFGEVLKRKLFRELGFSSIYQYAGEALGFSPPRTAQFLRLCVSLEELPALKQSVAAGEVSWTKAREVAKVATPQTDSAWVDLARTESRRKLERRVRMAQTHGRARRRDRVRQLGLADEARQMGVAGGESRRGMADEGRFSEQAVGTQHSDLAVEERPSGLAEADSRSAPHAVPSAVRASASNSGGGRTMPSDVAFAEVPVTLSLRFTPEQYARYEAMLEKLRKRGERAPREEVILAGLESLLVDSLARDTAPVAANEDQSASARKTGAVARREAAPVSECGAESASTREMEPVSANSMSAVSPRETAPVSPRNVKAARQIPVYQIVVQQCEDCGRARVQTSRGAKPIGPAAAEAMRCDARVLRPGERNRATIPPGVRREVMARDGHRCRAPGCGSARFLEVHHVVPRAAGGSNGPDNLVTLCSACHRLMHATPFHERQFARRLRE
jgi:hypothetical protein